MVIIADVIWATSSITDAIKSYIRLKGDGEVTFNDWVTEIEESTLGFFVLHFVIIFIVSLLAWLEYKRNGG